MEQLPKGLAKQVLRLQAELTVTQEMQKAVLRHFPQLPQEIPLDQPTLEISLIQPHREK